MGLKPMKKILVTGGTGYIGSELAKHLDSQGYSVAITSRNKEFYRDPQYEIREMDLLVDNSIYHLCEDIDCVVHTATFDERKIHSYPKETLLANGYGTKLLLESAKRFGVKRFIYLSTFHVYGQQEGYITEDTKANPISDYALTHFVGEMYVNQYSIGTSLDAISLRLTNGIGAPNNVDRWYLVVNDFCRSAYKSGEIKLKSTGIQQRDFISIIDVVKAIEHCIRTNKRLASLTQVFNVSSQESLQIRELASIVKNIYEKRYQKKFSLDMPEVYITEEQQKKLYVDSNKLRRLGWETTRTIQDEIHAIFDLLERSQDNKC
ncbi:hypothetical protein BHU72_05320 [Desulfuribacillus stibiiarsenatis]|uniref:NAD-dependent epimerase/dehydratase domain-containing protein n=2 Tax=Desulfuribacillus stibiiarsenatis TaxID=1390249 RepID=A0A1E5L5W7_9FIRM|nr:hypothetical protein BHU72_05320 [Desulfuribacillus stibiiarsenatis]